MRRNSRFAIHAGIVTVLGLLALPALTVRAQTVHSYPGCNTTLQRCLDAADPGDVVEIRSDGPFAESAVIRHSVVLRAAAGTRPRISGTGNAIGIQQLGATRVDARVEGLTVEGGIFVQQGGAGALHAAVVGNRVRGAVGLIPAGVHVSAALNPDAGPLEVEVRGNEVAVPGSAGGVAAGVRITPGRFADTRAVVEGNVITLDAGTPATGIALENGSRTQSTTVNANRIVANGGEGITLRQVENGELLAVILNNVVTGTAERLGAGVAVENVAGAVEALCVNNTVLDLATGIGALARPGAVTTVRLVNNLVARTVAAIELVPGLALVTADRNLLFDFERTFLGDAPVLDDPRLADVFRPGPDSPAVNAGAELGAPPGLTDVDGRPRVIDGRVDIGAAEQPCPDGSLTPERCPALAPPDDPVDDVEPAPCTEACDDGDPCTLDACDGRACRHEPLAGFAGARCACARRLSGDCAVAAPPRRVTVLATAACSLLARAESAPPDRAARLVRRASARWAQAAARAQGRRTRRTLSPGCQAPLERHLRDGAARAQALAATLR